MLSFDNGGITLEDAQVAVATLDPAKAFGPSAFGPLQFRVITHDAAGDWQPLATLVRLPMLSELEVSRDARAGLQALRLESVSGRLGLQRARSSTIRCRCRMASPATRCRCRGRPRHALREAA